MYYSCRNIHTEIQRYLNPNWILEEEEENKRKIWRGIEEEDLLLIKFFGFYFRYFYNLFDQLINSLIITMSFIKFIN